MYEYDFFRLVLILIFHASNDERSSRPLINVHIFVSTTPKKSFPCLLMRLWTARFDTMQIFSLATILLLLAAVSNAVKIFRLGNASVPVTKIRTEDFGGTNKEGELEPSKYVLFLCSSVWTAP